MMGTPLDVTPPNDEPAPEPLVIHPPVVGGTDEERAQVEAATAAAVTSALPWPTVVVVNDAPSRSADLAEAVTRGRARATSLDAVRGVFLLLMVLTFTLPNEHLPLWMYHRQQPFGMETPIDAAGISWTDLIYAAFLFTMAAAVPLAISRRVDGGETEIGVIWGAIKRWAMLMLFALLTAHSNTFFLGYTQLGRALGLVGFAIMALVYTRRRDDWDVDRYRTVRRVGVAAAVAFLALSPLTYGSTFSFDRIDGVIAGLAFAYLTGTVIWYFTRENVNARLAVLACSVALYLGAKGDGWLSDWWWNSGVSWAFTPSKLTLLTVVIPGTIAGDLILRLMRGSSDEPLAARPWGRGRLIAIAALTFAVTPIVTAGLYNRWVQGTTLICLLLIAAGALLTMRPTRPVERALRSSFLWASLWLAIGLFVEPFEGGIKKDPDTLSYFFTVTGTTFMLLSCLIAITDGLKYIKPVRLLVDVGKNPLLCYVVFSVFLNSLIDLVPPLRDFMLGSPLPIIIRCTAEVALVALIIREMSRRRIFWHA